MPRAFTFHRNHALGNRSLVSGALISVALVMVAAACGGGGTKVSSAAGQPATGAATNQGSPSGSTPATVLKMTNANFGPILTNAKGFVLYTYTADKPGGVGCTGSCLTLWPPLLLPPGVTHPIAGPGVSGLGTFVRPEGTEVTYQGLPLYTYLPDTRPGQVTGQGVVDSGGTWILATIGSPAAAATTAPSTASSTNPTTAPTVSSPAATRPPVTVAQSASPPTTHAAVTNPPATRPPVTSPPRTPAPTAPPTTPKKAPPTTAPQGGPSY